MSGSEWVRVCGVLAALLLLMTRAGRVARACGGGPEVTRKAIHVLMGLVCMAFPWVFTRPEPVWVLALLATVPLLLVRGVPAMRAGIGAGLHGVGRPSYGEILFAPAVALVFHLSRGDVLLHVIPVGILALADAAGALAGCRWGKRRYGSGQGFKSMEGSAAFLVTAFLCIFLPLWLTGRESIGQALWIAMSLAILAMMAEGMADRGFDNLLLPVGCHLVLAKLLPMQEPELAARCALAAALLALVVWGGRWSSLNGGALLGAALLGYGCAVLADWRFALLPSAVFVCHVAGMKKHRLTGKMEHGLDAVLSHAITCLPWVLAAGSGLAPPPVALAGLAFAMAGQLAMMETATREWTHPGRPHVVRAVAKGWLIGAMPALIWLWPFAGELAVPAAIALPASLAAAMIFSALRRGHAHTLGMWILQALLALLVSLPVLLLEP